MRRRSVATLIAQLLGVFALPLGVCVPGEHRHAGQLAEDCAMHHSSAPAQGGHGHHGEEQAGGHESDLAISCHCANDGPTLDSLPSGVVLARVQVFPSLDESTAPPARAPGETPLVRSPLAPPPKFALRMPLA